MTKVKQSSTRKIRKSIMSSAWFMAMQELFRPQAQPMQMLHKPVKYEGGRSKQYGQSHFKQNRRKDLKARAKRRAKKHKHN